MYSAPGAFSYQAFAAVFDDKHSHQQDSLILDFTSKPPNDELYHEMELPMDSAPLNEIQRLDDRELFAANDRA